MESGAWYDPKDKKEEKLKEEEGRDGRKELKGPFSTSVSHILAYSAAERSAGQATILHIKKSVAV